MEKDSPLSKEQIDRILKLIASVKFGSVNIVIQDGKVVQIEKHEKIRMT